MPKPKEEKRNRRVSVYFTDAEYAELLTRVKTPGELSPYARHQLFAGKTPYSVAIPEINLKAYGELGQAASNLNQIARKLNGGEALALADLMKDLEAFRLALIEGPEL